MSNCNGLVGNISVFMYYYHPAQLLIIVLRFSDTIYKVVMGVFWRRHMNLKDKFIRIIETILRPPVAVVLY